MTAKVEDPTLWREKMAEKMRNRQERISKMRKNHMVRIAEESRGVQRRAEHSIVSQSIDC
jgi:hypothetical protein